MMNRLRPALTRIARVAHTSPCLYKNIPAAIRPFTTPSLDAPFLENFNPSPPDELTVEMAEGIADATQFYVRHGVSNQRLKNLSQQSDMPAVAKWQKMMEVFLTTQVHVIAGLGYTSDEQGLTKYAQDLAQCLEGVDDTTRDVLTDIRRDTWRELVSLAFDLHPDQMKSLSIVDARNLMHKVSSKMVEPSVLFEIQSRCSKIPDEIDGNPEMALAEKHRVLQHVIVHHVYMSGNPSIVEETGFGEGEKGYAALQCAMSEYEGDPLINQYAAAAMGKVWEAAGLPMMNGAN